LNHSFFSVSPEGHKIKKNTPVVLHSFGIMTNPDVFDDPMTFKPERWLDSNGKYLTTKPAGFVTFGMGRRVCLGEKLAMADLFLIVVRTLQATAGHQFVFPDGADSFDIKPDPKMPSGCVPFKYKLLLQKV
jgi:cytochrome P450